MQLWGGLLRQPQELVLQPGSLSCLIHCWEEPESAVEGGVRGFEFHGVRRRQVSPFPG